jgi:hypothetical protein
VGSSIDAVEMIGEKSERGASQSIEEQCEAIVINVFHYTDKPGWNAIRAQLVWQFKVSQPRAPDRPRGAYFTNIEPTETNLRTLFKRIRVPKLKQDYVFWFVGTDGLVQLNSGLGRDKWVFFSRIDYDVAEDRQKYGDATCGLLKEFL